VAADMDAVDRAIEGDAGGVPSAVSVSEMVASSWTPVVEKTLRF